MGGWLQTKMAEKAGFMDWTDPIPAPNRMVNDEFYKKVKVRELRRTAALRPMIEPQR